MDFLEKTLKIVIEIVKVKHDDLLKRPDAALPLQSAGYAAEA